MITKTNRTLGATKRDCVATKTTKSWLRLGLSLWLVFAFSTTLHAIPNFGSFTDGRKIFDIRGRFESRLSLYTTNDSIGEKGQYFALTNIAPDYFTVDPLNSEALVLPPFMEAGDTVFAPGHGEFGFFFINRDGKLHTSLRHCNYYNDPLKIRRCDSLLVIQGEYVSDDDKYLFFRIDENEEPIMVDDTKGPEPITFCKDVNFAGHGLIHIKTPTRRLLIDVTPTGLSLYSAAWDQARRHYQRGQLIRHYRYSSADRATLFSHSPVNFPLIDIINRFYSKAVLRDIIAKMQQQSSNYTPVYIHLLQRLESQKVR